MAAGRIIVPPYFPARDRNGDLISGALLYVWENNTTTLVTIYADENLTVPAANPAVANASGQFPPVWAEAGTDEAPVFYRVGVTKSTGAAPGNAFIFDDYRPSVDFETAAVALAEAAAVSAAQSAASAAESAKLVADLVKFEVRNNQSLLAYLPKDLREKVVTGTNTQDLVEYVNKAASVPWTAIDLGGYEYLIGSRINAAEGVAFTGSGTFKATDAFSDAAYADGINTMLRLNSGVEVGEGVTFDGSSIETPNQWIWGVRNFAPVNGVKLCGTFKNLSFIGIDISSNTGFWSNSDVTVCASVQNVGWRGINLEGIRRLTITNASVYSSGFDAFMLTDCENISACGFTADKSVPPYRIYDGPGSYGGAEEGFLFGHFNIRDGRFSNFYLNDNRNAGSDGWGIGEDGSLGSDESRDLVVVNGIVENAGLFGFDCTGNMVVRGLIVKSSARQGIMVGLDLGGTIRNLDIEASVFDAGVSDPTCGAIMFLSPGAAPRTANTASGSPVVTITGSGLFHVVEGQRVTGAGIPAGAEVVSVSWPNVTLSANATATATDAALTFRGVTNFENIKAKVAVDGAPHAIVLDSGADGYTTYDSVEIGGPYARGVSVKPLEVVNGPFPPGVSVGPEMRQATWWGVSASTADRPVDASEALQWAIDGISLARGGKLQLPQGVIHIGNTIRPRDGVSLVGSMDETTIRLMDGSDCSMVEDENFDYFKAWTSGQPVSGYVQHWYMDKIILDGNGHNQAAPTTLAEMNYGIKLLSHQQSYGKLVVREIAGVGMWTDYNSALVSYFRNDIDGAGNPWPQKSYQSAGIWGDICVQDCLYEHVVFNGPADISINSITTNYCGWDTLPLSSVNAGAAKTSLLFPGEEIHSFRQGTNCHIGYANLNGAVCGRAFYVNGARLNIDTLIANGSWGQVLIAGATYGQIGNLVLQMTMFEWGGVSHPMLHCAKGPQIFGKVQFGQVTVRPIGTWDAYNGEAIRDDFGHQFGPIICMEHQPMAVHLLIVGATNRGGVYQHIKAVGLTGAVRDGRQATTLTIESGATDIDAYIDSWRCAVGVDNKSNNARINLKGTIRVNESGTTGQIAMAGVVATPAIASVVATPGVVVNVDSLRAWDLNVLDVGVVYRNRYDGSTNFDMTAVAVLTADMTHMMWRIPIYADVRLASRWGGSAWPDYDLVYSTVDATKVTLRCNVKTAVAAGAVNATLSIGR